MTHILKDSKFCFPLYHKNISHSYPGDCIGKISKLPEQFLCSHVLIQLAHCKRNVHITKKQKHFRMIFSFFVKSLHLVFYFILLINFFFIKLVNILVATNVSFTFLSKTKQKYQLSGKYCMHCDIGKMKHFKNILHNYAFKLNVKYILFKWDMKCTVMQLGIYALKSEREPGVVAPGFSPSALVSDLCES